MKSKKIIAISLIAAIMLGLTACGSDETSAPVEASTETSVTSESDVEAEVAVNQDESTGDTTVEENTTKAVETTTTQVNPGSVNPDDFWEGNTFHLDEYAEALGCDVRGVDGIVTEYGGNRLEVCLCPDSLYLEINEGFETQVSRDYHSDGDTIKGYLVDDSNIVVECCDSTITNNPDRLNNIIKTLQLFSSVDNPYEHIDDLDCWHK